MELHCYHRYKKILPKRLPKSLPNVFLLFSGFDDAFKLLDRLSLYVFDLPVNLAVQQFQQMEEAF